MLIGRVTSLKFGLQVIFLFPNLTCFNIIYQIYSVLYIEKFLINVLGTCLNLINVLGTCLNLINVLGTCLNLINVLGTCLNLINVLGTCLNLYVLGTCLNLINVLGTCLNLRRGLFKHFFNAKMAMPDLRRCSLNLYWPKMWKILEFF